MTEPLSPAPVGMRSMDALPRVRRCTSRGFFLLFLRTRSCAIGAEALSHWLNEVFAFLGRAMSDRAGARPYQSQRHRPIKSATPQASSPRCSLYARLFSEKDVTETRNRRTSSPSFIR